MCVCVCDVWSWKYKGLEVAAFVKKKNILVQYSDNFMHDFVKILFVFTFASFFIVMLFLPCSNVKTIQCNASQERNPKQFITCYHEAFILKEGEELSWERDLKKNLREDMFAGQGMDQFLNKIYEKFTPYSTTSQGRVIGFCTSSNESIEN